jgi:tetratricopeptide (TPR) repeat protein
LIEVRQYDPAAKLLQNMWDSYNDEPENATLLAVGMSLGTAMMHLGRYNEARELLFNIHQTSAEVYGESNDLTIIADLKFVQSSFNASNVRLEDEIWGKRLRDMIGRSKAVFGPTHQRTIQCLQMLARWHSFASNFSETLPLAAEVVNALKHTLGVSHPDTLKQLSSIAHYSMHSGRIEEASEVAEFVLNELKSIRPPDDLDLLDTMHILAHIRKEQKRVDEAEAIFLEITAQKQRVSGHEHPSTLWMMTMLGVHYSETGRYREAEKILNDVIQARRKIGVVTKHAPIELAVNKQRENHLEEAERMLSSLLDEGLNLEPRLMTMLVLGETYQKQGKLASAVELLENTLLAMKPIMIPSNATMLRCMEALALTYREAGREEEGIALSQQAATIRMEAYHARTPGFPTTEWFQDAADASS